jgi:hypothetical protein
MRSKSVLVFAAVLMLAVLPQTVWDQGRSSGMSFAGPVGPSSTTRSDALVLVNSLSDAYGDFQHFVQPYLDHFGIPYTTLDIATTPVDAGVGDYALIIVGHRHLDPDNASLDATEQAALSTAVNTGTGLVNFDNDLWTAGGTPRYQFVNDIFAFGQAAETSGSGVSFPGPTHYITERHAIGSSIGTGGMTLANVTLPAGVTAVATTGTQPFMAVATSGTGRALQWGSYEWMSTAVKGPMYGLDDLVWRGFVWAARKPFVMQGLPPFVTMRVDDESGGFEWIHIANEFGFKPWAGLFISNIDNTEAADLSALTNAGLATTAIHAFDGSFFYFDHGAGGNYPDATVAANFVTGTAWHVARNIPISKYVLPHYYEFGSNVFQGLADWGVEFVGTQMDPGNGYGAPWVMNGPFRLYETGGSGGSAPQYYADFMTIPGHPEFDGRFFNCVTEIRDDAGYEWYPDLNDVPGTVGRGTRQTVRALDAMALSTLFTHAYYVSGAWGGSAPANWRAILTGITANLASYDPIYVSMDEACRYIRAVHTSNIGTAVYDPALNRVTTTFTGTTDIATKFYIFNGDGSSISQVLVDVPQFTGTAQVVYTLPGPLARIDVTPNPATVVAGTLQQFAGAGFDADGNPIPNLHFAWSLAAGGGAIDATGRFTAGVTPGTYTNTVTATSGAIQGRATVVVMEPVLDHFDFAAIGSPKYKDAAFTVTVTARDGAGNRVVGFAGSAALTDTTGTVTPATIVPFAAGVWQGQVTIAAEATGVRITATGATASGQSNAFDVAPMPTGPASLWPTSTIPGNPWNNDTLPLEVGVKFRAAVDGYIIALRYYQGGSNNGPHVGHLWDGAGTLLAQATFINETGSGWQEVALNTPVPVRADTTYVASYHTGSGYAADRPYFTSTWDRPPLRALRDGEDGGNGLYKYDSTCSTPPCVPDGTYQSSNYWVDVVFSTSATPPALPCAGTCRIWSDTTVPTTVAFDDTQTPIDGVDLGVKFRTGVDGWVTGLLFYKGPQNTGMHIGTLWSSTGSSLAQATFVGEAATGWQQVLLEHPVHILAGPTYVASYHTYGKWSLDRPYFTTAHENAPLTALADGADGGNGIFAYGPGQFPNLTYQASNYWVDVMFTTTAPPPDTAVPTVTIVSPPDGTLGVDLNTDVTVTFSEAMDAATITAATFRLRRTGDASDQPATVSYADRTATLHPSGPLAPGANYQVTVAASVADLAGNPLGLDYGWTFTTGSFASLTDTTAADFSAGTPGTCAVVAHTGDGEVTLAPTMGEEFSGPGLPDGWVSYIWNPGGTVTVSGGKLTVNGARANPDPVTFGFAPGRSLEFSATYATGTLYQQGGFGGGNNTPDPPNSEIYNTAPMATFSSEDGTVLRARAWTSGSANNVNPVAGSWFGAPHRYRMVWNTASVEYYIDGAPTPAYTWNVSVPGPMRPAFSEYYAAGGGLSVDWMRMSPFASPCAFESRIMDAGHGVNWLTLAATGSLPTGTGYSFETRTAMELPPGGSWTAWTPVIGNAIASPNGRYLQYRATLTTSDDRTTPELQNVTVSFDLCAVEVCNGLDDDCDGVIDNGNPGGGGACTTGMPGSCSAGTQQCQAGALQCVPSASTPETCDGLDNDCNGVVDDVPPATVSLATGLTGVPGQTLPPVAIQVSDLTGRGVYAADLAVAFDSSVLTAAAVTDGTVLMNKGCTVTSNSDVPGRITLSLFCTSPLAGAGSLVNVTFHVVSPTYGSTTALALPVAMLNEGCPAVIPVAGQFTVRGPEICDGQDNDGNGLVDDGLGQTTCGLGVCQHTIDNCVAGVVQTCDPMQGSHAETCNGLDDNCDGIVDNGGAALCDDGNLCNGAETCGGTAGCQTGTAVVCTALDQCHDVGTCEPTTGVCSNPAKANGAACNDSNACTQTDTCESGACVGGNPVVCTALDQCHVAGVCDTTTGVCTNPDKANGTTCNDGDACTQTDTCESGACVGSNPVTCTALDQCHVVGVCDTATGVCTNPDKANGTACNDSNACTQTDTCESGACVGSNPVTCTALDQCHAVGVCDTATGVCSNPDKANGTACNDGNACTQTDTCESGACVGGNPVICMALDQCHEIGVCNTGTGVCTNPDKANGTACNDGNACTQTDTCQAGACVGGNPVVCNDNNPCTDEVCNPATGGCVITPNDGNSCTDNNVCTTDTCSAGACLHTPSGVCGVSGEVYYYRNNLPGSGIEPTLKPVPSVGVDVDQSGTAEATTGSDGAYTVGNLAGNARVTPLAKLGSLRIADHNGAITSLDASMIARSAVGLITLSPNQVVAGDVTGNGTVGATDASQVARFATGMINHFDVALTTHSDWRFLRCDNYIDPNAPGCADQPVYDFTPLTQAETGKNFYAVLYGDVTGNWQPASGFSSPADLGGTSPEELAAMVSDQGLAAQLTPEVVRRGVPVQLSPQADLTIGGWTSPLKAGERRQLTINLANADGILGLDLVLKYDPSRIRILGVGTTGIGAGQNLAQADAAGTCRIAAYGLLPLAGSGPVLTVTVEGVRATGARVPLTVSGQANEGAIPLRILERAQGPVKK